MNESIGQKITPAYLQIAVRYIYTHTSSVNIDTTHSSSVRNQLFFHFVHSFIHSLVREGKKKERKKSKERAPVQRMNEAYRSLERENQAFTRPPLPALTTPEGRRRKNYYVQSGSHEFNMLECHTFRR
jgi:hypothetical protein